jgi:hypothetical protein
MVSDETSRTSLDDEPTDWNTKTTTDDMAATTNGFRWLGITSKRQSNAPVEQGDQPAAVTAKTAELGETWIYVPDQRIKVPSTYDTSACASSAQGTSSSSPRSALKQHTSNSPKPQRSVSINPEVIIFPTDDSPPKNTLHNEHMMAEKSRGRPTYSRSSSYYKASTWATPDGYERIDTSHCKTTWGLFDYINQDIEFLASEQPNEQNTTGDGFVGFIAQQDDGEAGKQGIQQMFQKSNDTLVVSGHNKQQVYLASSRFERSWGFVWGSGGKVPKVSKTEGETQDVDEGKDWSCVESERKKEVKISKDKI